MSEPIEVVAITDSPVVTPELVRELLGVALVVLGVIALIAGIWIAFGAAWAAITGGIASSVGGLALLREPKETTG